MRVLPIALFTLAAISAPAFAGGFDHYDKNADGYITADELGEKKAYKIEKMDSDGDGQVSLDEYKAYKASKKRSQTS